MFNYELPRRGKTFVTKKSPEKSSRLFPVNPKSSFWEILTPSAIGDTRARILQRNVDDAAQKADDFVLATGETFSVIEFVEKTFEPPGIEIGWRGEGIQKSGLIVLINEDALR
jgi:GDPmannose 4,6-dehydratase